MYLGFFVSMFVIPEKHYFTDISNDRSSLFLFHKAHNKNRQVVTEEMCIQETMSGHKNVYVYTCVYAHALTGKLANSMLPMNIRLYTLNIFPVPSTYDLYFPFKFFSLCLCIRRSFRITFLFLCRFYMTFFDDACIYKLERYYYVSCL